MFELTKEKISVDKILADFCDDRSGAFVQFCGIVRNHNEGKDVKALSYEAYDAMAIMEGEAIMEEVVKLFPLHKVFCVHRTGDLQISDMAVWVGVLGGHRDEAFKACRYIIDEIKARVPIWKKEHYVNGPSEWVYCPSCANYAKREKDHHTHCHHKHD